VSIELDAPAGHDRELLSMGLALEGVLGVTAAPPGARPTGTQRKSAAS